MGSDGGPQFTSHTFTNFLKSWGIYHRLSSAEYPQSNGRAEIGVKTAKRILMNNLGKDGSLNNDRVTAALLQYKNTPLPDIGLSPAQILFHRELRDTIPSPRSNYHLHKDWVIAAEEREALFAKRNKAIETRYNQHTRALPDLSVGTNVLIQTGKSKWKRQGVIVERLAHRQYRIKVYGSGRITLRNRRFIKPCTIITPPHKTVPSSQSEKCHTPEQTTNIHHEPQSVTGLPTTGNPTQPQQPLSATSEPIATTTSRPQSLNTLPPNLPHNNVSPYDHEHVDQQPPPNQQRIESPTLHRQSRSSARLQNQPPERFETDPKKIPLELRKLLSHNSLGLGE